MLKNKKKIILLISLFFVMLLTACQDDNKGKVVTNEDKKEIDIKLIEKNIFVNNKKKEVDFNFDYFYMNTDDFAKKIDIYDELEKNKEKIKNDEDIILFIEDILEPELSKIYQERLILKEKTVEHYSNNNTPESFNLLKAKEFEKENIMTYNKIYQLFQLTDVAYNKTNDEKLKEFSDETKQLLDVFVYNQIKIVSLHNLYDAYEKGYLTEIEYTEEINNYIKELNEQSKKDHEYYKIFRAYVENDIYK